MVDAYDLEMRCKQYQEEQEQVKKVLKEALDCIEWEWGEADESEAESSAAVGVAWRIRKLLEQMK